jgi:hypothetical protein
MEKMKEKGLGKTAASCHLFEGKSDDLKDGNVSGNHTLCENPCKP